MFNGSIRELRAEDIEAVEQIFDLYWTDYFRAHLSERLHAYVEGSPQVSEQHFKYFVAEEDGEVVGVAALRSAPEHMRQYAQTTNPAEFYVAAAKYRNRGIGTALRERRLEEAKKHGYTEVLFFGGEKHKDSWAFHDDSDFERAGPATSPDGEAGYIWRKIL